MPRESSVILWRRLDIPGHDACRLEPIEPGWRLTGTAVFLQDGSPARLDYSVVCDAEWRSRDGVVRGWIADAIVDVRIHQTAGTWAIDGMIVHDVQNCVDLDLGFTPATNVTQLRRIALEAGQAANVPAAWFDLATRSLSVLEQRYERRTADTYWYEAPRFGYSALLQVDRTGFVRHYPGLWKAETQP